MVNSTTVSARVATRARVVLWHAEGCRKKDVAARAGVSRPTVDAVLRRFAVDGVSGLLDKPVTIVRAPLVPPQVRARILALSRSSPPSDTGLSHWSSRALSDFLRRTEGMSVSHNYIAALWREHGLTPWRVGTFKLSRDPAFAEKVADCVGLYLEPPGGAVVLSVDEKSQIQALDRTQPGLPLKRGRCGTMTHDDIRNGTTPLFAALDVAAGKVIGRCMQRHRHQEFIRFLNTVEAEVPAGKLVHAIVDNHAVHKHPKVAQWLARHPRWTFHFTPTSASWLHAVEGFFAKLTKRRLRRGVFGSLVELQAAINCFLAETNVTVV